MHQDKQLMKTTLEFNLPEDREDFELAIRASAYYLACVDIRDFIRAKLKYGDLPDAERGAHEEIQAELFRIFDDREIFK